ncbi:MAG: hypothetical protein ACC662_02735 [Planctomycetota bacterium]
MLRFTLIFAGLFALAGFGSALPTQAGDDDICQRYDMEVTCSVSSPKVLVGDPFDATATVTNTGTIALNDVTFVLRGLQGCSQVGDSDLMVKIDTLGVGESRDLTGTFVSNEVGQHRIDASAREEKGWASAGCVCGVLIEGLPAIQLEMIDVDIQREPAGIFEEGENFLYALDIENDVGTAITPDLQITWTLPPELEFVSGTGDRGVTITGSGQSAQSSAFVLAPNEQQRFELVVKVIGVPKNHLVQTRASVTTLGGVELATETESTTLRPASGR